MTEERQQLLSPNSSIYNTSSYGSDTGEPELNDPRASVVSEDGDLDSRATPAAQQAGMASSIFNLVNVIVGGGFVSLPFAYLSAGYIGATIILASCAILSGLSANLLLKCMYGLAQKKSYRNVGIRCWGWIGGVLVDISIILMLFGAMTTYLIISAQSLTPLVPGDVSLYLPLMLAVLVMPICLIERIHYLRYISILSLLLVSYAMCIIVFHFAELIYQNKRLDFDPPALPVIRAFNWSSSIFVAIPIVAFCFVFHMSVFPIYNEMRNRTDHKMNFVVYVALTVSSIMYFVIGFVGYANFGDGTLGNFLENYGSSLSARLGKAAFGLAILLTCPVLYFIMRISIENVLFYSPESLFDFWKEDSPSSGSHSVPVIGPVPPRETVVAASSSATQAPTSSSSSSSSSSSTSTTSSMAASIATKLAAAAAAVSSAAGLSSSSNDGSSEGEGAKRYSTNSSRLSYTSQSSNDEEDDMIETEEWTADDSPHGSLRVMLSLARPNQLAHWLPRNSWRRRLAILLLAWTPAVVMSSLVYGPQYMLAYVGSTGGALLVYILPGIFFLQLHEGRWYRTLLKLLAVSLIMAGLVFGFMGCVSTTLMAMGVKF